MLYQQRKARTRNIIYAIISLLVVPFFAGATGSLSGTFSLEYDGNDLYDGSYFLEEYSELPAEITVYMNASGLTLGVQYYGYIFQGVIGESPKRSSPGVSSTTTGVLYYPQLIQPSQHEDEHVYFLIFNHDTQSTSVWTNYFNNGGSLPYSSDYYIVDITLSKAPITSMVYMTSEKSEMTASVLGAYVGTNVDSVFPVILLILGITLAFFVLREILDFFGYTNNRKDDFFT